MCQEEGDHGLCAQPPSWLGASWQPGLKGKHVFLMEFPLTHHPQNSGMFFPS